MNLFQRTVIRVTWLLMAALAPAMLWAQGQSTHRPAMPSLQLPEFSRGQRAIDLLGPRLPEVAAHYRKTPEEFSAILRRDPTARLDRQGRLFHIEEFVVPQGAGTAAPASTPGTTTSYPLDQTFLLHSRPGASKVIYLDFNGHTASGTAWNSSYGIDPIVSPAFDLDGVPSTFSTTELQRIQMIWKRVAEDYAPFDVDVTTEEPPADRLARSSTSDTLFGVRAVITRDFTAATASPCGCGGFAYVGVFDYVGETYKPAYVFFDKLGGGNEKYVAEAISHEVGHTLGLSHDGTATAAYYTGQGSGATGWAPIMGVGYYQPVVQWSRGEYTGANNREDDIAIIQSNGVALRTDDHGDSTGAATVLSGTTASGLITYAAQGVIGTAADVDAFAFAAGAGTVTVSVAPALTGPNLDVKAELRSASGTLLTSAPLGALGATLNATLPAAGTYYLLVSGVGEGDPLLTGYSDYGSLGEFAVNIQASAPSGSAPVAVPVATPASGTAPLSVSFSGAGSSDADGSIVSYVWKFGDGTADATGVTTSHVYQSAGTYTATLTVTDNSGYADSKAVTIQVGSAPVVNVAMYVQSIGIAITRYRNGQTDAQATVTVLDANGNRVVGATVTGSWSGLVSGTGSATTSSSGVATFKSPKSRSRGTFTFTVSGITLSGFSYAPARNLETSDSASN